MPGDGTRAASGGVSKGKDLEGLGARRLGHGHAGGPGLGVDEELDLRPLAGIEFGMRVAGEEYLKTVPVKVETEIAEEWIK